jgi:hypothetical protein
MLPFRYSKLVVTCHNFLVAYYKSLSAHFSSIYTIITYTSVYPYTTPLHHFSALLYLIRLSASIYASIICIHLSFLTFLYLLYSLDIFSYLHHIIFSVFTHYLTPSASVILFQLHSANAMPPQYHHASAMLTQHDNVTTPTL